MAGPATLQTPPEASVTLILGGARSGKSAYGETLVERHAQATGGPRVYLATAEAGDDEMAARIAAHRARRGNRWTTVEEPIALADALSGADEPGGAVLVDCLTLWVSNLMAEGCDVAAESASLVESLDGLDGTVVFVANEVGLGVVPDNAMAREFRDHAGRLNQDMAQRADRVVFMAAGLPLALKGEINHA